MFGLTKNNNRLDTIDLVFNHFLNDNFIYNNSEDSYISEDDKNYCIELAVPGLDKKDINIDFNDGYLYLNYESKNTSNKSYWNQSFKRSFRLPKNIKTDCITAKLKNGILSIQIQKDQVENKTIKIPRQLKAIYVIKD